MHLVVPFESSLDISAHNNFASAISGRHATFDRSICLSDLLKIFLVAILGAMMNKNKVSSCLAKLCNVLTYLNLSYCLPRFLS